MGVVDVRYVHGTSWYDGGVGSTSAVRIRVRVSSLRSMRFRIPAVESQDAWLVSWCRESEV